MKLLLFVLVLTACGDDSDNSKQTSSELPGVQSTQTVQERVKADEEAMNPPTKSGYTTAPYKRLK